MTTEANVITAYPKGFLERNLKEVQCTKTCEGACESHEKGVRPVRVIDPNGTKHDWGYFSYCQAAIREDKLRGLVVLIEGDDGFLP